MLLSELFLFFELFIVVSNRGLNHNIILPRIGIAHSKVIVQIVGCSVWIHIPELNELFFFGKRRLFSLRSALRLLGIHLPNRSFSSRRERT
jgi:hypothetical protein